MEKYQSDAEGGSILPVMKPRCAIDAGAAARSAADAARARRVCAGLGHGRAFTLAEMVVVLAIISMLGAMAIYRPSRSLHAERARAAAERIVADLALAQRRAVQSSAPVTVEFNPTTHQYRLVGLTDPNFVGKEYIVDLTQSPYEVRIGKADFGGLPTVRFGIRGAPSAAGEVVVTSGDVDRKVAVEAETGRAAVQ